MRLYIYADSGSAPRFHLPWDYHLSFQSFVYDALETHEPDLANELHDTPYAPPFSFSEFIQTSDYDTDESGLSCEAGYWVLNSGDARIIDAVANHARGDELKLGHTLVPVQGVEMEQISDKREARYRTVSPMSVTRQRGEYQVELHPEDPMWAVEIRNSVRGRMEAREYDVDDFDLDIIRVHSWKKDGMKVNSDHKRSCTYGEMTINCGEVTSRFIQRNGLAEGSGMGMSCVMPVDHIPESKRFA